MKEHRAIILPAAWNDLDSINEYISQNDPIMADHTIDMIIESIQRLETFPFSAPLVSFTKLSEKGYRVLRCEKYLCFYRITDKKVLVYHIIHGARDYPVLLKRLISEKDADE